MLPTFLKDGVWSATLLQIKNNIKQKIYTTYKHSNRLTMLIWVRIIHGNPKERETAQGPILGGVFGPPMKTRTWWTSTKSFLACNGNLSEALGPTNQNCCLIMFRHEGKVKHPCKLWVREDPRAKRERTTSLLREARVSWNCFDKSNWVHSRAGNAAARCQWQERPHLSQVLSCAKTSLY